MIGSPYLKLNSYLRFRAIVLAEAINGRVDGLYVLERSDLRFRISDLNDYYCSP